MINMTTYSHPDGKSDPCSSVQLHHQVDVDKHAYDRNEGQQGNLKKNKKKNGVTKHQQSCKSCPITRF